MMPPVFRFAPSPNGPLHLGHAKSALLNFDLAQRMGGRFLIRIEDIDTVRCTEPMIAAALEDLAWLGLTWEQPVLRQSERFDVYRAAANVLESRGLLYACAATRRDMDAARAAGAPCDPDGALRYTPLCGRSSAQEAEDSCDLECHRLAATGSDGAPPAAARRLALDRAMTHIHSDALAYQRWDYDGDGQTVHEVARPELWGDVVLLRKDTPASYHLACVIDDAEQGVTHVVRGQDLEAATDLHVLLQHLLGLPTPVYHHHALVTDATGRKLSKRDHDTALRHYRANGATPDDIRRLVGLC
ncbi:MAG: tRNA glutamyl-Q(34) synthetase GluQRS [Pseudomonadota bacterium]